MVGRESKFTPETCSLILEKVRSGNFIKVAAKFAGITERTLFRWLERGKSSAEEDEPFRQFRQSLRRARAHAEVSTVDRLAKRDTESADKWLLEKSFAARWGQKSKLELSGDPKHPVAVKVIRGVSMDDL